MIYKNGVLDNTKDYGLGLPTSTANLLIGKTWNGAPLSILNGSIDEVLIFNRSLSEEEIKAEAMIS